MGACLSSGVGGGGSGASGRKPTSRAGSAGGAPKPPTHEQLADETFFSVDEVYALEELFRSISNSLVKDGLIHKDELSTALFGAPAGGSLLTDRIFTAFDPAANDVIDFPEFVRGLSAFHPAAPPDAKADFSFRMYDLGRTGAIEPGEVRRLLGGLVRDNPALSLSDADVEALVDAAMADADAAGDGVIHPHEWRALVGRCPGVAGFMTLPALASVTTKYPSFVLRSRH